MQNKALPQVSLLGTGAMGSRMAMRLQEAGFALTVWNRTPMRAEPLVARGARLAPSPADAAAGAQFVLVMVEADDASQAVWSGPQGLGAGLARGAIAIDCSTLSVPRVEALAGAATQRGWRFLEAPVSGSLPQAEAGALAFFVGGAAGDVAEAGPLLCHLGKAIHHLGAPPMATRVKLAVNGMLACQIASAAETFGYLAGAGLAARDVAALLADTPAASPIVAATGRQIAAADFAPLFPIALMGKDLGYLAAAVAAAGAAAPQAACAQTLFRRAEPWQSQNVSAVAKLFAAPLTERSLKS